MIAVIDYGMGNLHSVRKALQVVGARVKIASRCRDLTHSSEKIVFPGVGAFGDAMKELKKRGLVEPIRDAIEEGRPFLGLCLGLQLLFEKSEESPGARGLCVLKGEVKRFKFTTYDIRHTTYGLKVPHMGWNNITYNLELITHNLKILKNVPDGSYMYFVHSYYVKPTDKKVVLATTDYGIEFVSGICKERIYGFQFHPEKSQELGLKILKNFVEM